MVTARRVDRLERLVAELGDRATAMECDVTDTDRVEAVVAAVIDSLGQIDVLINSAGISYTAPAEDEPIEQFERVLDVNVAGVFRMCQAVGRHMIDRGEGSIVNVASILGLVSGAPMKQASYSASKGAVINLTRDLGAQWARKGVRVNALAPGWFESEMTEQLWADERSQQFIERNTPMGRRGEAHELDAAILFLADPTNTFMTGQVVTVDGGWTAR